MPKIKIHTVGDEQVRKRGVKEGDEYETTGSGYSRHRERGAKAYYTIDTPNGSSIAIYADEYTLIEE